MFAQVGVIDAAEQNPEAFTPAVEELGQSGNEGLFTHPDARRVPLGTVGASGTADVVDPARLSLPNIRRSHRPHVMYGVGAGRDLLSRPGAIGAGGRPREQHRRCTTGAAPKRSVCRRPARGRRGTPPPRGRRRTSRRMRRRWPPRPSGLPGPGPSRSIACSARPQAPRSETVSYVVRRADSSRPANTPHGRRPRPRRSPWVQA